MLKGVIKIKVLMFGWEFPPLNQGGLGTACEGLVKSLITKGIEITLVLPQAQEIVLSALKVISPNLKKIKIASLLQAYQNSESYDRAYKHHGNSKLYGENIFAEVSRYALAARELIAGEEFDLIHAHDWLTFQAGIIAKEVSGKPLVVHVHATEFDRSGGNGVNPLVYDIEREGMEKADGIITVSNFTKNKVVEHYGVNPAKISVVHNGVSLSNYNLGGMIKHKKQEPLVLFLGRVTLQKGPDYFIATAKRVLEYNSEVTFVLAGSGDMTGRLIQQVAAWGIGDKVLFTGFLRGTDVDKMYQMADLYVMPSVSEPFGITPLEAMRNGVPVLISKQSGVSEVINHCFKTDFWDIDETASDIISLLEHHELQQELSRNGQREALKLSWDIPAEKCIAIYNNLSVGVVG